MENADPDRAVIEIGEIAVDGGDEALRLPDHLLGGAEHGFARLIDMADGGLDVEKGARNLARDAACAERHRVELGGLLLEHSSELGVGLVDEADRGIDLLQRGSRALDGLPDVLDLLGDILGRLRGLG